MQEHEPLGNLSASVMYRDQRSSAQLVAGLTIASLGGVQGLCGVFPTGPRAPAMSTDMGSSRRSD